MAIDNHLVDARSPLTHQALLKFGFGSSTLTGNVTLTKKSSQFLRLDPGGASRTITLPSFENGLVFYIQNTADAAGENLVISDGSTVETIGPGQAAIIGSDGSDWYTHGLIQTAGAEALDEKEVLSASGTIAAGAVATLNATPVVMVAAPAAGYYIEPVSLHWFLDFESAAYDAAASGDTLVARYTGAMGAVLFDAVAGDDIGAAMADYHALVQPVAEVVPVAAAAVVAHITTGEWFAAAGDSPLKWEMLYRVRSLAFA